MFQNIWTASCGFQLAVETITVTAELRDLALHPLWTLPPESCIGASQKYAAIRNVQICSEFLCGYPGFFYSPAVVVPPVAQMLALGANSEIHSLGAVDVQGDVQPSPKPACGIVIVKSCPTSIKMNSVEQCEFPYGGEGGSCNMSYMYALMCLYSHPSTDLCLVSIP